MIKMGEEQIFSPFVLTVLASCMLYSLFPHLFTPPTPSHTQPHTHTHTHTHTHSQETSQPSPISPPPPLDGLAAYPHNRDGSSGQC